MFTDDELFCTSTPSATMLQQIAAVIPKLDRRRNDMMTFSEKVKASVAQAPAYTIPERPAPDFTTWASSDPSMNAL